MQKVEIFTDGSCLGNPGPGGWGAILRFGEHEKILQGSQLDTTNNRMELQAAISALEALKKSSIVLLITDSQYLRKGITEWLVNWKQRGWKTASKKDVKNKEYWQKLDELSRLHQISWKWVKAHAGYPENERADKLAREAANKLL